MDILEFQGEHRWLSNFWPVPVVLDGAQYPSVEHAYQAAKFRPDQRQPFGDFNLTAGQAKRLGRTLQIRPDWEMVKLDVMRVLVAQKFAQGTVLAQKLEETGESLIVEGNKWGDTFWGVCKGQGHNWLGRLIMAQREINRNS